MTTERDTRTSTAEHPHATRFRRAFEELWEQSNPQLALGGLCEDVIWRNDIGAGPWRMVRGQIGVAAMLLWSQDFFEGTFHQQLIDVCASDRHVVEILHETGARDGQSFDNRALYVFELEADGRAAAVTTFDQDRAGIEAFWSAFPAELSLDTAAAVEQLTDHASTMLPPPVSPSTSAPNTHG
jgi:hypothetical protein